MIREISAEEIYKIKECLEALAVHHNQVSLYHNGIYPLTPHDKVIEQFKDEVTLNKSKIAVVEVDNKIIGFSKIDLDNKCGYLSHLVVLEKYRGRGYGKELMEWAMKSFRNVNIKNIELKVVAGNDTIHLYEKYGFKHRATIMRYTDE